MKNLRHSVLGCGALLMLSPALGWALPADIFTADMERRMNTRDEISVRGSRPDLKVRQCAPAGARRLSGWPDLPGFKLAEMRPRELSYLLLMSLKQQTVFPPPSVSAPTLDLYVNFPALGKEAPYTDQAPERSSGRKKDPFRDLAAVLSSSPLFLIGAGIMGGAAFISRRRILSYRLFTASTHALAAMLRK